jgi:hypothetical protein
MPDGSVCLAAYVRRWGNSLYAHGTSPVISSVTLSEDEFRALAPREVATGAEWKVPEAVARRFARITSPLCYQHAPQPDWVRGVRISAKVSAIRGDTALLRYEGKISSAHVTGGTKISEQETTFTGEGVYDVRTKAMRSLLLVGSGRLLWTEAPERPATFHALVEWTLEGYGGGRKGRVVGE